MIPIMLETLPHRPGRPLRGARCSSSPLPAWLSSALVLLGLTALTVLTLKWST